MPMIPGRTFVPHTPILNNNGAVPVTLYAASGSALLDANGAIPVTLATQLAGEDSANNRLMVGAQPQYVRTIQTHTAVALATTATSDGNAADVNANGFIDVRGYSSFAVVTKAEATAQLQLIFWWSPDGTTAVAYEQTAVAASASSWVNGVGSGATITPGATQRFAVKAGFVRVRTKNPDTTTHTYDQWVTLYPEG